MCLVGVESLHTDTHDRAQPGVALPIHAEVLHDLLVYIIAGALVIAATNGVLAQRQPDALEQRR